MTEKHKNIALVIIGGFIFGMSINLFLMPLGLYNGGLTGVAQLVRDAIVNGLKIKPPFDLAGVLTFLINIPIFIFASKRMSKRFVSLTIIAIISQTIAMSLTPIPKTSFINDIFVGLLIAAIVGGWAVSLTFKGKGSAGGLDVIGIYQSSQNRGSVGKYYILINSIIYLYCFIFLDLETAIYSLLYSTIFAFTIDKYHHSNIEVSVMVFTNNKNIKALINKEMRRGATYWQGYGSYTDLPMEVFVSVVSQEEVPYIKRMIHEHDPKAFIIISENLKVHGGYEKRLI